jgi:hypothetical protein
MNQTNTQQFERENTETHFGIVKTLADLIESGHERYSKFFAALETLNDSMVEVKDEMIRHFEEDRRGNHVLHQSLESISLILKSRVTEGG